MSAAHDLVAELASFDVIHQSHDSEHAMYVALELVEAFEHLESEGWRFIPRPKKGEEKRPVDVDEFRKAQMREVGARLRAMLEQPISPPSIAERIVGLAERLEEPGAWAPAEALSP